jgi:transcription elongation factor Elf1|tara:strand:+ start:11816 stop:12064 length:249 start_codon:yes stop_codon:yes gene_type:complete
MGRVLNKYTFTPYKSTAECHGCGCKSSSLVTVKSEKKTAIICGNCKDLLLSLQDEDSKEESIEITSERINDVIGKRMSYGKS